MTPETFDLPVTSNGVLRLSPRLRETYLTPEAGEDSCVTQAAGRTVHVWFWSDRDNIRLDLQTDGFDARRPYRQSVHRWGVNINRYLDTDDASDGTTVVVDRDGEKPTTEAEVTLFEGHEVKVDA